MKYARLLNASVSNSVPLLSVGLDDGGVVGLAEGLDDGDVVGLAGDCTAQYLD